MSYNICKTTRNLILGVIPTLPVRFLPSRPVLSQIMSVITLKRSVVESDVGKVVEFCRLGPGFPVGSSKITFLLTGAGLDPELKRTP